MQKKLIKAIVYSQRNCPGCDSAKALLRQRDIQIEERMVGDGWTKQQLLEHLPGVRSVPQVVINGTHVGGLKELQEVLQKNMLDWAW